MACNPCAVEAVLEFHNWVFGTYLPQRYPLLFTACHDSGVNETRRPRFVKNNITAETIAVVQHDPDVALKSLNANIDTDFVFLLPSSRADDGQPIYHEEAFIATFPNGFSFRDKLSLPLAAIHKPVPGYASKLERSMDRYFAKLAVGTVVTRANWSITTHSRLFAETGNHFYKEDEALEGSQDEAEVAARKLSYQRSVDLLRSEIKLEQCRLRCERQTLHRLPKSGAIVFGIKTYQYTLQDVKATGDGHALADAIDGLGCGNVPDMLYYKRGIVWGDKVADYLRSGA